MGAAPLDLTETPSRDRFSETVMVVGVRFVNEEGFAIVEVVPESSAHDFPAGKPTIVKGELGPVAKGVRLEVQGQWEHSKWGWQVKASLAVPTTEGRDATLAYLASGVIPGIGPGLARRLDAHFGDDLPDVLDKTPERLSEVRGIGKRRASAIGQAWQDNREVHHIMRFLTKIGLGPGLARRVWQAWEGKAVARIKQNPYRLTQVARLGFEQADRAAQRLGLPSDSPERAGAAIRHVLLEQAQRSGHTWVEVSRAAAEAASLLGKSRPGEYADLVDRVMRGEQPVMEPDFALRRVDGRLVASPAVLMRAEQETAAALAVLMRAEVDAIAPTGAALEKGMTLSRSQAQALDVVLNEPVSVVTGGPGTGKSTMTRCAIHACCAAGLRVEAVAPTGRAARRLAEASDHPAQTIHRLLGYGSDNPVEEIDADVVVVDEASMVDIRLIRALAGCLRPGTRLLLIGDVDQLPSVGPGAVLREIIASQRVPVARLLEVHRQAADSGIIAMAQAILRGRSDAVAAMDGEDAAFLLDEQVSTERVVEEVKALQSAGYGPDDIQVLTPRNDGPAGVDPLNEVLADHFNPKRPGLASVLYQGREFRVGDRVMQLKNRPDLDISNGDIGKVVHAAEDQACVDFGGVAGVVTLQKGELGALRRAYAATIHKAQGSEFAAVIVPLTTRHAMLLDKQILYTGATRAKQALRLVGERKALRLAVESWMREPRQTGLRYEMDRALAGGRWYEWLN